MRYSQFFFNELKSRCDLLRRAMLACVCVVLFALSAVGQEPSNARLVDELGSKYSGENLLSRLDVFAAQLSNERAKGVIIFYQGNDSVSNIFTYRFLLSHKITRNTGDLYRVVPTRSLSKDGIEFWVDGDGKMPLPKEIEPGYQLDLKPSSKPVYFSGDLFERVKIGEKWTILEMGCPSVCINIFNLGVLKNFIDANPSSIAYLVLRGKWNRAEQVKALLMKESKEMGFTTRNIRFVYAGSKMINDNKRLVEVEAFISMSKTNSALDFPYQLSDYN